MDLHRACLMASPRCIHEITKAGTLRPAGVEAGPQDQGEEMTTWNDTPPTEDGTYWVRSVWQGEIDDPVVATWNGISGYSGGVNLNPKYLQFGPRIPSADDLAELQAKAAALDAILATWGMTWDEYKTQDANALSQPAKSSRQHVSTKR